MKSLAVYLPFMGQETCSSPELSWLGARNIHFLFVTATCNSGDDPTRILIKFVVVGYCFGPLLIYHGCLLCWLDVISEDMKADMSVMTKFWQWCMRKISEKVLYHGYANTGPSGAPCDGTKAKFAFCKMDNCTQSCLS